MLNEFRQYIDIPDKVEGTAERRPFDFYNFSSIRTFVKLKAQIRGEWYLKFETWLKIWCTLHTLRYASKNLDA